MAMLSGFLPMLSWSRLEGVPVPNHFDIHGVVDGVGDRGILLTLALIGLGIYIIMILAQCFPKVVNLPVPARKAEAARAAKCSACSCPSEPTPHSRWPQARRRR